MRVEVAVVADYANQAEGQKLNVMGVFDRIHAPSFPTVHAFMVLAFRLRLEFGDRDQTHKLEIGLFDEDGQQLGGGGGEIGVGAISAGDRLVISQILPFPGIVFPHAGEYSFVLKWNGAEVATVPISLVQQPGRQATTPE